MKFLMHYGVIHITAKLRVLQAEKACIPCECPYHGASQEKVMECSYTKPSGHIDVEKRAFRPLHKNMLPTVRDPRTEKEYPSQKTIE